MDDQDLRKKLNGFLVRNKSELYELMLRYFYLKNPDIRLDTEWSDYFRDMYEHSKPMKNAKKITKEVIQEVEEEIKKARAVE